MIDKDIYNDSYWKYYRSLEDRFLRTEDYVAFDTINDNTYSIEYLTLLQTVCSEIDVVAKTIALHFDTCFKPSKADIKQWGYGIQKKFPRILTQKVVFRNGIEITPWNKWQIEQRTSARGAHYFSYSDNCGSPEWWKSYTAVKHARTSIDDGRVNYTRANQKNVIYSFAALYLLHRLMLEELGAQYGLMNRSVLFRMLGRYDEEDPRFIYDMHGHVCQVIGKKHKTNAHI